MSAWAWEYWGKLSTIRDLVETYGGAAGGFVPYTLTDAKSPKTVVSLTAKGVPTADMQAVRTQAAVVGGFYDFILADGSIETGIIVSFSASPIEHQDLWNMDVNIRTDGSSEILWGYWSSKTLSKELTEFYGGAGIGYSVYTLKDTKPPKEITTLTAEGVPSGVVDDLLSRIKAQNGTSNMHLADGSSVPGIVTNVSAQQVKYTGLYNVSATVRNDGSSGPVWQYWGEQSGTAEFMETYGGTGGSGDYTLTPTRPIKTNASISAKGVPADIAAGVITALSTAVGSASFPMAVGPTITGTLMSYSCTQVEHTDLWDIKAVVRVDGKADVVWRYWGSEQTDKNITEFHAAPASDGAYGPVTFYDQELPKKTISLTAEGVGWDAAEAEEANAFGVGGNTPGTVTIGGYTGYCTSFSREAIKYTNLFNLKATLRVQ